MTYQSGYGFPAEVLGDAARMQRLFDNKWFFVGMRADVARPRDYFKFKLFDEEYFLVHGQEGQIKCYVNRCAHQSARLVNAETGRCAARIICPNHQWAFDVNDGSLAHASQMPDDFVKNCPEGELSLTSIVVREVSSMLFACLGDDSDHGEMDRMENLITPYTDPFAKAGHGFKQAYHSREIINANWLLVMINNRECCHCDMNHKGLVKLFDPSSFNGDMTPEYKAMIEQAQSRWDAKGLHWKEMPFAPDENFRIARYPMAEGFKSITFDGELASQKLIGPFENGEPDEGTLSLWLNPNCWVHFTSDHIATNWVLPLGQDRCALYTSWIVHEDAVENTHYDKDHMTEVWNVTNAEDVGLCKSMSEGAKSRHYKPGPFSQNERFCTQFCDWYMENSV